MIDYIGKSFQFEGSKSADEGGRAGPRASARDTQERPCGLEHARQRGQGRALLLPVGADDAPRHLHAHRVDHEHGECGQQEQGDRHAHLRRGVQERQRAQGHLPHAARQRLRSVRTRRGFNHLSSKNVRQI